MQIIKCDRCGKEIIYHPAQQTILPKYAISAMYSASDIRRIDLCDKCQQNLTEWLHGKNLKTICHKIELEADYQNENVNADIAKGMYKALNMLSQHLSGEDKTDADSD